MRKSLHARLSQKFVSDLCKDILYELELSKKQGLVWIEFSKQPAIAYEKNQITANGFFESNCGSVTLEVNGQNLPDQSALEGISWHIGHISDSTAGVITHN